MRNGAVILVGSAIYFVLAYVFYGRFLKRLFGIDPSRRTPAHAQEDGVDYVPTRMPVLFGHHFASIAGAGPIVGPIAAAYFGWLPALLWILIGCVFVGAMHDFAALFLSARNEGRSIGHVIEKEIGFSGRQMFLLFAWAALVLVVAIFALLVAKTFVATPAVATASLFFIAMAPVFGYLTHRKGLRLGVGTAVFVPLLFLCVWIGVKLPLDIAAPLADRIRVRGANIEAATAQALVPNVMTAETVSPLLAAGEDSESTATALQEAVRGALAGHLTGRHVAAADLHLALTEAVKPVLADRRLKADVIDTAGAAGDVAAHFETALAREIAGRRAQTFWLLVLFAYVFVASTIPVWMLLQPRDYLNSYLLYGMIVVGFLGVLVAFPTLKMPAFAGFMATSPKGVQVCLFPLLFVTIACGACSGFHALVSSGTTAKQLTSEAHILPVGYGSMLVEGLLAIMALISVGYLAHDDYNALLQPGGKGAVYAFSSGIATFATRIGLPLAAGRTFVALAISAFMLTTLDTATRLTRFTWQELFLPRVETDGGEGPAAASRTPLVRCLGNSISATVIAVVGAAVLAFSGGAMQIWPVFGASNQLLAALTLLAVTVYLVRRKANCWVGFLPMVFMIVISSVALVILLLHNMGTNHVLFVTAAFLLVMAAILVVQAAATVRRAAARD